jgi:prepilin-type N-terminal cleavage/methylation domain-containing protein
MASKNKGFTLIELLVVIAIIGILAGLVVVSMSGAESSAHNARVQSDLDQIRSTAEVYRLTSTNTSSYANLTNNNDIKNLLNDCNNHASTSNSCVLTVKSDNTAWCAKAEFKGSGNWCADSSGYAGNAVNMSNCTNNSIAACR